MARCTDCNKWFFPWNLTDDGICNDCHNVRNEKAEDHKKQLEELRTTAESRILCAMPRVAPGEPESRYFQLEDVWEGDMVDNISFRFTAPVLDPLDFLVDSLSKPWVSFHIATTGLDHATAEIIAIGAVLVENNEVAETYFSLIKPGNPIPESASSYNGITNEMVKDAPSLFEVLPAFAEFVGRKPCVVHNLRYALQFLFSATHRNKLPFLYIECADTVEISRKYWPDLQNHKLISIEYMLHGDNMKQPTALDQARLIVDIVKAAQKEAACDIHHSTFETRFLKILKENAPCLQKDILDLMPNDSPARIRNLVNKMSIEGKIVKKKQGSSFFLSLPET